MTFIGCTSIDELLGKRIGVLIRTGKPDIQSITAEIFIRDGVAVIDCIPMLKRKHTVVIPSDAMVAKSVEKDAPWPFAIFITPETEAALFISNLLRDELRFRN